MPFKIFQLVANLNEILFAGFDSTPSNSLTNKGFVYLRSRANVFSCHSYHHHKSEQKNSRVTLQRDSKKSTDL